MTYFTTGTALQTALSALPAFKTGSFTAFDSVYYGANYMAGGKYTGTMSPIDHFVATGAAQGFKPNATFDPVYYMSKYSDLQGKGYDAADLLFHFMQFGLDEGRVPNASFATFDAAGYFAANPDVATFVNANLALFNGSTTNGAIAHFVKFGAAEGRAATGVTSTMSLTVAQDTLTGTNGNDTFNALVAQNAQGFQTNQFATGDALNGGAGTDSLVAVVQKASALGNSPTQAITAQTTSVEKVSFTALTVDNAANPNGATETVVVNAKSMIGLTTVSSVHSDASLTVENLTTLTDSGVYADRRNTDSITIRMDHSGNDDAVDAQSNMRVLFDNDYLRSGSNTTDKTYWWLLDQKSDLAGGKPLAHIDSDGLKFTIDGVATQVQIPKAEFDALDGSYAKFVAALNAQIAKTPALTGYTFTLDASNYKTTGLDNATVSSQIPAIVLTAPSGKNVVSTGFTHYEDATGSYDVLGQISDTPAITVVDPITSNIELFKVGRGAEGGSLTVGAMNGNSNNEWDKSATAIKEGVEKFNVKVFGDSTQFSDLSYLQSTNNTLKEVQVTWDAASTANLTIGNHNTISDIHNALKDVRTFNAANAATANVTVNASVTNESVAKYMDRVDNPADAAADNANFAYTFGAGNDKLDLTLSKDNLEASGTTNREDFKMAINMGAGNNTVVTSIDSALATTSKATAWYANNVINANLSIVTGAGNDTITTKGAGAWTVDAGAGSDAVYTDNSGKDANFSASFDSGLGRGAWVFNSTNQTNSVGTSQDVVGGLTSATAVAAQTKIAALKLTVTYKGLTSEVFVGGSDTATSGVSVTDLTINQAIKAAISGDIYLSKLLLAQDGPGRTLIVKALTDGVKTDANLSVSLSSGTASATQTGNSAAVISTAQLAALGFTAAGVAVTGAASSVGRFDSAIVDNGANQLAGANSTQVNSNTVVDGTGGDVIVLSSSGLDTQKVNLTADATKDVIYNATNADITGLVSGDVVITSLGTVYTTFATGSMSLRSVIAGTATGTANADIMLGSTAGDIIIGAAGADTMTGNGGNDTFQFAANDSGTTAATIDKITDMSASTATVTDSLVFTDTAGAAITTATVAAGGTAAAGLTVVVSGQGLVTFAAADDTLAEKIAAVQADAALDGANKVAIFQDGGNTYVYYSGVATGNTDDQIIELTGTAFTAVTGASTTSLS